MSQHLHLCWTDHLETNSALSIDTASVKNFEELHNSGLDWTASLEATSKMELPSPVKKANVILQEFVCFSSVNHFFSCSHCLVSCERSLIGIAEHGVPFLCNVLLFVDSSLVFSVLIC